MSQNPSSEAAIELSEVLWPELLVPPDEHDFGTEPEVVVRSVRVYVGNPVAVSIRELLRDGGKSEFENEMLGVYDIWLLFHSFTVSDNPGGKLPIMVKYEVEFRSSQVLIADVGPHTSYITIGQAGIGFGAKLDLSGRVSGAAELPTIQVHGGEVEAGAKATVAVSGHGEVAADVTFALRTPVVTASGVFNTRSDWSLRAVGGYSLFGDHIVSQTVVVPRGTPSLAFLSRVHAAVPIVMGLGATLKPSEWKARDCILDPALTSRGILRILPIHHDVEKIKEKLSATL